MFTHPPDTVLTLTWECTHYALTRHKKHWVTFSDSFHNKTTDMLEYCFTISLGKGYFGFLLDYVTEEPEGGKVIYRGAANILLGWDDWQLSANRVK